MDLVRLALERATTAREGVEVITALLEAHGQGGGCAEGDDWTYHNGFLLADRTEAWVLETAGEWWAAEVITTGARHISNGLSIRGDPSARGGLVRPGLLDHARSRGYWRGDVAFDWASCFGSGGVCAELPKSQREAAGARLLAAKVGSFAPPHMMEILRDEKSGICMTGAFRSTGSQVSRLPKAGPCHHWLTGTADPNDAVFKLVGTAADGGFVCAEETRAVPNPSGTNPSTPLFAAHDPAIRRLRTPRGEYDRDVLRGIEKAAIAAAAAGVVPPPESFAEAARREMEVLKSVGAG